MPRMKRHKRKRAKQEKILKRTIKKQAIEILKLDNNTVYDFVTESGSHIPMNGLMIKHLYGL